MTQYLDGTAPVRPGEELDLDRLIPCLLERIPDLSGPVEIEQFPSGHSNLTYLIKTPNRELVLRRPPFGSRVKSAHDMGREFSVLSRLHGAYPPAPRPLLYVDDDSVVGAPFYVMERLQGVILRARPPKDLALEPDTVRRLCESFVDNLVTLHSLDYRALGLDDLRKPGQYVERQVQGWTRRYEGSKTDDIPEVDSVIEWLNGRIPPDTEAVLLHNDYKFDNVVLDPVDITQVVGVLDWEMATVGDPLADLGTSLSYWIEPADEIELQGVQSFVTFTPGALTRAQVVERYAQLTNRDVSSILFYYVLGLFKLAVIVQQIYYRYAQGHTQDPRFAPMIHMVRTLGRKATEAIESERL